MSTKKGIVLGVLLVAVTSGVVLAEPSYLVYPSSPAVFRYDTGRFELLTSGSPNFDESFSIAGKMLWDRVEQRVPIEIYRAPELTGFEPSGSGHNEFATFSTDFDVIVDGFGEVPRTLGNLCLRFWPEPSGSFLQMVVNGQPLSQFTVELPPVEVVTPLAGGYYADVGVYSLTWLGATRLRILAFSDKDANGAFDGTPIYEIVAYDLAVSVEETTWGKLKSLYRE